MGPHIRLAVDVTCPFVPLEDFIVGLHYWIDFWIDRHGDLHAPFPFVGLLTKSDLGSRAWIRIGGRLVRDSDSDSQLEQTSNHRDMDSQYATVDQLAEITDTMASLRDAILGLGQRIDGHQA